MLPLSHSRANTCRYNVDRLGAFSDAVIAIAITILVLGLEVPSVHEVPESGLSGFLKDSVFSVLGYVLSFFLIGTYWLQHYEIFHFLSHVNRPFAVLNLNFLLFVSFIPFPTGLHVAYWHDELSVILFAMAQIACALSLLGLWIYATWDHRLVADDLPQHIVSALTWRITVTPMLCLVAIAVSFINPFFSRLVFATIPLIALTRPSLDTEWRKNVTSTDE